jgi:hypothetical protein
MPSFFDPIPNSPFYTPQTYSVNTPTGSSLILGTGISVDAFGFMNVASALGGTVTSVAAGVGLSGGPITTSGIINLVPATSANLGGIKVGANLSVAPDGTLSALAPGVGTITGVIAGVGLNGGGTSGNVTLNLNGASTTQLGGVSIAVNGGISVTSAVISLAAASTTQIGGVRLATSAEVIAGADASKVVTPATLATKVASTTAPGIVQLSNSVSTVSSILAATPTAVKTAYDAAVAAQATANAALPITGGTMTGIITFAPGQAFPGVALPKATTLSLGVISVGPGLNVNSSGVLSTANNGTVTAVAAGEGLGAPATGNTISTSGTLRLLPPTTDGLKLGGVKAGANINIAFDGTISVPGNNFVASNNPYAFNGYVWPAPLAAPSLPFPGTNGQVLTVLNNVAGTIGWTSAGTLATVTAGTGIAVSSTPANATVSLATVPSVTPGNFGGTGLIPTLAINQYGQIISTGLANPYAPFQAATQTAPPVLVLDFDTNNTNWSWTLQGNTTIQNPLNAQSGMTGSILLSQNATVPAVVTWGSAWKFANFTPYTGNPTAAAVDLIQFTVVSANYIVVTAIISNLG